MAKRSCASQFSVCSRQYAVRNQCNQSAASLVNPFQAPPKPACNALGRTYLERECSLSAELANPDPAHIESSAVNQRLLTASGE